ncbi:MAG: hypothetical protein ACRD40_03780 [Candidatus Acidiferrales bacterium]
MFGPEKPLSEVLYQRHLSQMQPTPFPGPSAPFEATDGRGGETVIHVTEPSLQDRLWSLKISDPELKKRRRELLSALAVATSEAKTFLETFAERRHAELEEELEGIRKRGREQEKAIEALTTDQQNKFVTFQNLRNRAEELKGKIVDAQWVPVGRFAGKAERDKLQRKIDGLQEQLNDLGGQMSLASQEHNEARMALEEAHKVMQQISNDEVRCRGELSGAPYRDPETALMVTV